ncbi:hypothetical protein K525DRAFT_275194 [Schizophyllum commune Loenen D]|nr:hypothetical protein K525DRAFT_275194 [Schizophyllum commune Loenen D]
MRRIEDEDRAARPLSHSFTFTIRKERIPTELSAGDFRLLLAGKYDVSPPVAATQDEVGGWSKRGREDCQNDGDSESIDAPGSTDPDAGRESEGPSEGSCDDAAKGDDAVEGHPPQKKRKVNGSIASIPIPPIPAATLQVGGSNAQHATSGGPESKSEQQVVRGSLSDISKACSLRHVSSKSKFFSSDHGPLTFGDKVDAFVGGTTFRYILFAGLDDAALSGSLNATQATMVHRALFSAQLTKRVASALGFPSAPKEHDPFMCALGRATYHRSIQEIQAALFEIYDPIIRLVLKAVAPLHSSSDDTRFLDSRRQHLCDLLELSSQGYAFHSGLSPFEAVLTTADHIVAAMLTEDLLTDLGIIRPVAVSA